MKRRRTQFRAAVTDGGLVLEPGNSIFFPEGAPPLGLAALRNGRVILDLRAFFHEDIPTGPSITELTGWMLRLRGRILSEVFGLENDLIFLELANQFGSLDPAQVPALFHEEQRLREEHSLNRKIDRAKPIIRRLRRDAASASRLIQALADCREARNLMAHYPCWLEPVNDKEKVRTLGFRLFIGDRSHVWELDNTDVRRWAGLFLETRRELVSLRYELIGEPPPAR